MRNKLTILFTLASQAQTKIALIDSNIVSTGAKYIKVENNELALHRHSDKIYAGNTQDLLFSPLKARSGSGIILKLKTKSPSIKLGVVVKNEGKGQAMFGVKENGKQLKNIRLKNTPELIQTITLNKTSDCSLFEVSLPLWVDVHITSIELESGFSLEEIKKEKKGIYVAYGDSITHGRGQDVTEETYAYQLAEALGMELFNIAVGGGKASKASAEMIANDFEKIDLITILIGYNDLVGNGVSPDVFQTRYEDVLSALQSKHKNTNIVCVTMLTTTILMSKKLSHTPDEFREVVRSIVNNRIKDGDKNLLLVEGPEYSSKEGLNDPVHLNKIGATAFSKGLFKEIKDFF